LPAIERIRAMKNRIWSKSSTVKPLVALAFVCAAGCAKETPPADSDRDLSTNQSPDLTMELPDLKSADGGADLARPADLAVPFTPIPGGMLGVNVMVNMTCDYDKRSWVKDAMGVCQRSFAMNKTMPVKTIRIDAMGAGKYRITAGITEPFAMDYTVDIGEEMTLGAWTDGGDPVAATKRTHFYTLNPTSLQVETDLLHDNDTPLPPVICTDYYFERTKCTGSLTW
jgi:hypothetical protein